METAKRPVAQVFMLVLALLGVGISIYLTLVHYDQKDVPLVCSTRGFINCENVLTSPYALVPGLIGAVCCRRSRWPPKSKVA